MVKIFELGDTFWIEFLQVSVTLMDAAGSYQSGVMNLSKSGNFLACSVGVLHALNDDNTQAIGIEEVRQSGGGQIAINDFVSAIRVRTKKAIGTAGNNTVIYSVMLFMRRPDN